MFDDKNRIRAWIAMDLAGSPLYPDVQAKNDVHFTGNHQKGNVLYEQFAAAATPQLMEQINNSLDIIAQNNEQPDKIGAFFNLLRKLTGFTMSPRSEKVMTQTVMD